MSLSIIRDLPFLVFGCWGCREQCSDNLSGTVCEGEGEEMPLALLPGPLGRPSFQQGLVCSAPSGFHRGAISRGANKATDVTRESPVVCVGLCCLCLFRPW